MIFYVGKNSSQMLPLLACDRLQMMGVGIRTDDLNKYPLLGGG